MTMHLRTTFSSKKNSLLILGFPLLCNPINLSLMETSQLAAECTRSPQAVMAAVEVGAESGAEVGAESGVLLSRFTC